MNATQIPPVVIKFMAQGIPEAERAFSQLARSVEKLDKTTAASAMENADKRIRAKQKEASESMKLNERYEREAQRNADASLRIHSQEYSKQTREYEKSLRDQERARERLDRLDEQAAKRRADSAIREANRVKAHMDEIHRRMGSAISSSVGNTFGGLYSGAKMALGAAAGIGGGFAVADVIRERMSAEKNASLLINIARVGGSNSPGMNTKDIIAQAAEVSAATGMSKDEVISGSLEYARKARGGDFAGAMANMKFFAKLATVSGTSIQDVASAAGTLQSQNEDLTAPEMQQMLLNVYAQGGKGNMSLVDTAKQIGTLASARSSFAGDAARNQLVLMGLGQIAAPEGTVEETGVAVKNLAMLAQEKRDKLEDMGVHVFKHGKISSPEELIEGVFRSTGGDMSKIMKVFGPRGSKVFENLSKTFDTASKTGGTEAGIAAVHSKIAGITGATMTMADLNKQVEDMVSQPGKKIEIAFQQIKEKLDGPVSVALERFANDVLPKLLEHLDKAIDWLEAFAANPGISIGALLAASIVKDIVGAQIGVAARAAMMTAIESGSIGQGLSMGISAITSLSPAILGVVGAFAVLSAAAFALSSYLAWLNKDKHDQNVAASSISNSEVLIGRLNSGNVQEGDIEKAKAMQEQLSKNASYLKDASSVDMATSGIADIVTGGASAEKRHIAARELAETNKTQADLAAALMKFSSSHDKLADALKGGAAPGAPGRGSPATGPSSGRVSMPPGGAL